MLVLYYFKNKTALLPWLRTQIYKEQVAPSWALNIQPQKKMRQFQNNFQFFKFTIKGMCLDNMIILV